MGGHLEQRESFGDAHWLDGGTDKICWVGTVRYNGAPIPVEEEMAVANLLASMSCFPVFITQIMHHQFYEVFCKQNLWLLLHHVADVYGPLNQAEIGAKGQQDLWFAYSTVNRLFRDKVVEIYQKGRPSVDSRLSFDASTLFS